MDPRSIVNRHLPNRNQRAGGQKQKKTQTCDSPREQGLQETGVTALKGTLLPTHMDEARVISFLPQILRGKLEIPRILCRV